MSELKRLTQLLVDFRDTRDWKQFHNHKDQALSLVLEAAELLEHFQWKNEAQVIEHCKTHKEAVADELADVFFWVLVMSHDLDIDIAAALEKKMIKNGLKYPVEKCKGKSDKYTELK